MPLNMATGLEAEVFQISDPPCLRKLISYLSTADPLVSNIELETRNITL